MISFFPGAAKAVTMLAGPQGPGIRMSLHGVDVNEIFPMPEVVALLDADTDAVSAAFAATPPLPADAMPWDSIMNETPAETAVSTNMPSSFR